MTDARALEVAAALEARAERLETIAERREKIGSHDIGAQQMQQAALNRTAARTIRELEAGRVAAVEALDELEAPLATEYVPPGIRDIIDRGRAATTHAALEKIAENGGKR